MKPETADDKLPRLPDGRSVVTVMMDPDASTSLVSMVDKGASGRRFRARKGVEDVYPAPPGPIDAGMMQLDLGTTRNEAGGSWWWDLWRGVFQRTAATKAAEAERVAKYGGPVMAEASGRSFAEVLAPTVVRERMWEGFDALRCSLGSILEDHTVPDKRAAWAQSIGQFTAWAMELLDRVPAAKRDEYAAELKREPVIKAGRVLSAASMSKLTAAATALQAALAELENLKAAAEPATPATVTKHEDPDMLNLTQIAELADLRGKQAMNVRKSLNAGATVAELEGVYNAAAELVTKALAMQPAIPQDALQTQMGMQGLGGSAGDPMVKFEQALSQLGTLVRKMDETLHGKKAAKEGDKDEPGIADVVKKHHEVIVGLAGRVQKIAEAPAGPARGEEAGDGERGPVRKRGDVGLTLDVFAPERPSA